MAGEEGSDRAADLRSGTDPADDLAPVMGGYVVAVGPQPFRAGQILNSVDLVFAVRD